MRAQLRSGHHTTLGRPHAAEGLFVIEDGDQIIGAVTYEVAGYDTGLRVLDINYAGGVAMESRCLQSWKCSALKRHFMCDRVDLGRKGWIRYMKQFGFTDTHYSVEME